ncbi:CBN-SRE-8 protein [Aphelenchoides avenae]|nr:CBN-SRE-8 protein [Aphelenchus avenae]
MCVVFSADLIDDPLFSWAGTLRCYFLMLAGLTLPAATFERIVATACAYDYETKRRTYVSSWLILVTNALSFVSALSIMHEWLSAAVHMIFILAANAFGLAGFLCCHKKNSAFYSDATNYDFEKQRPDRHYSLSQRFQIVENIRVGHLLKYYYLSIWVFNLMICGIYLMSMVLDDQVAVNITYEMFDIGIAMYANVVPLLNMPKNPAFQADWNRFLIRWGFRSCSVKDAQGKTYVKTVFGANLPCSPREQAVTYFVQLERAWSADPKMRKA